MRPWEGRRQTITTDKAPAAIGPYSQAKLVNGVLYASGQIPLIPATGELREGGIIPQTELFLQDGQHLHFHQCALGKGGGRHTGARRFRCALQGPLDWYSVTLYCTFGRIDVK